MAVKPSNILYGVDERPPLWITAFLGFQHVCIIAIALIFPVVIVHEAGAKFADPDITAARLVSCSMLAGGIGVIVQALRRGPVGSGYLCPQVVGPSFLTASIMAVKTGGLSLLFGMTLLAGAFEALLSRVLRKLRALFPAEVTGLIVAMVGITVIRVAAKRFLGIADLANPVIQPRILALAVFTLFLMIGLNVWSRGQLKLFCVLIGMIVGYVASWLAGVLTAKDFSVLSREPWFWFPVAGHCGFSFDWELAVPFGVAMLCSSLKTVGDLTTCQKINDVEWRRPDMNNISKGILADATGCVSAGLLGGVGQSSSSTNIGLTIATGVTSRVVAWALGTILIVLAFFPRLAMIFVIMPAPVMGATLVFALSFMIVAGMQIIMSRMMDSRKTFVVGVSMIVGMTVDVMPAATFDGLHHYVRPIFSSSLSAATVCAVVLNLIMRIGISRRASLELKPGEDASEAVFTFMERQGGLWGARKEIIHNATAAMNEVGEAALVAGLAEGPVVMTVAFDEFNLDVTARYKGKPMEFPEDRPSRAELREDPEALARLAGFLVNQYADSVDASEESGDCQVRLHFVH